VPYHFPFTSLAVIPELEYSTRIAESFPILLSILVIASQMFAVIGVSILDINVLPLFYDSFIFQFCSDFYSARNKIYIFFSKDKYLKKKFG